MLRNSLVIIKPNEVNVRSKGKFNIVQYNESVKIKYAKATSPTALCVSLYLISYSDRSVHPLKLFESRLYC